MRCDRAQAVLSARMDDARVPPRVLADSTAHAERCAMCRTFAERSAKVRTLVRIRPAEPVPDLVESIMAVVAAEAAREGRGVRRRRRLPAGGAVRDRWKVSVAGRRAVAAVVVGVLVGSLIVGGPWGGRSRPPIAIASVASGIRASASALDAYAATFVIEETGLSAEVPERRLEMDVAFLAPQRFRLDVRDLTEYPSVAWTPTDLRYIEAFPATYRSGPTGCPGDLPPDVCLRTSTTVTRVSEFSMAAPVPADLIVPLMTFGSTRGVRIVGTEPVGERDAIHVQLSFARASALFPFLRLGGTWRPFYDGDQVDLWLDAEDFVPLLTTVSPSEDPERRGWEMRFGRDVELPGTPILEVRATQRHTTTPDPSLFAIPGAGTSDIPLAAIPEHVGYVPAVPSDLGDLELISSTVPGPSDAATPRSLLVYAKGLDYLRVAERPDWSGPGPFGPLGATAEQIRLPDGGVGYYEPAGEGLGRRLSLHAIGTDVYLETNLPRDRLLTIASSLPVRGTAVPPSWRTEAAGSLLTERVEPAEAAAIADLPPLPSTLPHGYVLASAWLEWVRDEVAGVTFTLRQRELDAAGPLLELRVERRDVMPPMMRDGQPVTIGSTTGRWVPGATQLAWVEGGIYRSLEGPVDLRGLVAIAEAISVGST